MNFAGKIIKEIQRQQIMQNAVKQAEKDRSEGKSPSTQASEFVREEFHHIREGKHGARSTRQAIAIGLSKARRAGVRLPPPKKGRYSDNIRRSAKRDLQAAHNGHSKASPKRSRGVTSALRREGHSAASRVAISRQTHRSARNRTSAERSSSARKAARTRMSH
jgi:hypothetical protein